MAKEKRLAAAAAALRKRALAYPKTVEEFPWDHSALKVKRKVFLFLFRGLWKEREMLSVTMKLPDSHQAAVALPFARPSGYGLGKSGWVTCQFFPGDLIPIDMLTAWLDESFRAIAPAKVVAAMDGAPVRKAKTAKVKRPTKKAKKAKKT